MILANAAKCLKCGDEIYSAFTHDFTNCSCDNIFVDGGMSYIRHGFKDCDQYKDMSIEITDEEYKACIDALEWCDKTGRNNLGRVCAIFRSLRDSGYIKEEDE